MEKQSPVFRSLEMIEERIHEKLTVETLADSIHLSRYHYQRLFRDAVGESVMKYVAKRRISLAAEELAKTDATILDIALQYGYDSHEGFTRSFKAYLGVTPAEYRKYFLSIAFLEPRKERTKMSYGKNTGEIIRELNGLIVEARETAAYLRKNAGTVPEAAVYIPFWEATAVRTEAIAGVLEETLRRVTAAIQQPDGISARFLLIKAMEDATFSSSVTAFQAGLMMARAKPGHRAAFLPACERCSLLAENARIRVEKIAAFFQELAALIFQDMKREAQQRIERAAKAGLAAAGPLSGPDLPYGYISFELQAIAKELSDTPPGELSAYQLENGLLRLDIISMAAETDILRTPAHQPLLNGIPAFRERLKEALEFWGSLPDGAIQAPAEPKKPDGQITGKQYSGLAFQGNILLFYLRGELQKLEKLLDERQKPALDAACGGLDRAIRLAGQAKEAADAKKLAAIFLEVYETLEKEAFLLGGCGAPLHFIAKELKRCIQRLQENIKSER